MRCFRVATLRALLFGLCTAALASWIRADTPPAVPAIQSSRAVQRACSLSCSSCADDTASQPTASSDESATTGRSSSNVSRADAPRLESFQSLAQLGWFEHCTRSACALPTSPTIEPDTPLHISFDELALGGAPTDTDDAADLHRTLRGPHHGVLINDVEPLEFQAFDVADPLAPVVQCANNVSSNSECRACRKGGGCSHDDAASACTTSSGSDAPCPCAASATAASDPSPPVNTILDIIDRLGGSVVESPELTAIRRLGNPEQAVAPCRQRQEIREALVEHLRRLDDEQRHNEIVSVGTLPEPEPVAPQADIPPEAIGVLREAAAQLEYTANMLEHHDLFEQADQVRAQADLLREEARATVHVLRFEAHARGMHRAEPPHAVQREIDRLRDELTELEALLHAPPEHRVRH